MKEDRLNLEATILISHKKENVTHTVYVQACSQAAGIDILHMTTKVNKEFLHGMFIISSILSFLLIT